MSLRPLLDDVLSFYFQVKSLDHRPMQKHELLLMEEILAPPGMYNNPYK